MGSASNERPGDDTAAVNDIGYIIIYGQFKRNHGSSSNEMDIKFGK